MAFRYSFKGKLKSGQPSVDEFGNPTDASVEIPFNCDYQPTVKDERINSNSTSIPVSFKIFVQPNLGIDFKIGDTILCNSEVGTIIRLLTTRFNTEIWVR